VKIKKEVKGTIVDKPVTTEIVCEEKKVYEKMLVVQTFGQAPLLDKK
jgi:hypothetical protein